MATVFLGLGRKKEPVSNSKLFQQTIEQVKRLLKTDPQEAEKLLLSQLGNIPLDVLSFPTRYEILMLYAKLELEKPLDRDLVKARKHLEEAFELTNAFPAVEIFWKKAEVYRLLARICLQEERFEEALDYYVIGTKSHEGLMLDAIQFSLDCRRDPKYRQFLQSHGDKLPDPLKLCEEALQRNPRSIPLIFMRATLFFHLKDWNQARDIYLSLTPIPKEGLEKEGISKCTLHDRIADCFMRTKAYSSAAGHLVKASAEDDNPIRRAERSEKLLKARAACAILPCPDIETALQLVDPEPEAAVQFLNRIINRNDSFEARLARAKALIILKKTDSAQKDLLEAWGNAQSEGKKALVFWVRGKVENRETNFAQAERCFEKVWKERKITAKGAYEYIAFLKERHNFAKASSICREAKRKQILSPSISLHLLADILHCWILSKEEKNWPQLEEICLEFFQNASREDPHYLTMLRLIKASAEDATRLEKLLKACATCTMLPYPDMETALQLVDPAPEAAVQLLNQIINYNHSFEASLARAKALINMQQTLSAQEDLLEALEYAQSEEKKALVFLYRGKISGLGSDFAEAKAFFEKAWKSGDLSEKGALEYINLLKEQRDFSTASNICYQARRKNILSLTVQLHTVASIYHSWVVHSKEKRIWVELEQTCFKFFQEVRQENPYYLEMLYFAIEAHQNLQHYGDAYSRMRELEKLKLPSNYLEWREKLQKNFEAVTINNHFHQMIEDFLKSDAKIDYLTTILNSEYYQSLFPEHIVHRINLLFLRGDLHFKKDNLNEALADYTAIFQISEKSNHLFDSFSHSKIATRITYINRILAKGKEEDETSSFLNLLFIIGQDEPFSPEGIKFERLIPTLLYKLD